MPRLYLFAEGQTEQTFAGTVLGPHLSLRGVYLHPPVLVAHARRKGKVHRGGGGKYVPMRDDIRVAIIAPDGRDAMLEHAAQLAHAHIDFVFDPGQALPMFDGAELRRFVEQAAWIAVNDYEGRMLCERTGQTLDELSRSHLRGVIVTLGAQGCDLWQQGLRTRVPGVAADAVVDPTGCGDAFRAGLLYGIERDWSLERCVQLGNHFGAVKIACRGGQNHRLDHIGLGI